MTTTIETRPCDDVRTWSAGEVMAFARYKGEFAELIAAHMAGDADAFEVATNAHWVAAIEFKLYRLLRLLPEHKATILAAMGWIEGEPGEFDADGDSICG